MVLHLLEELPGRQVEGDVRLTVRVEQDDVVSAGLRIEPVARVRQHLMSPGVSEMKVAMAGRDDVRVDLHPRDVHVVAKCQAVLPGRRACGETQDGKRPRVRRGVLGRTERVGDQQVVPVAMSEVVL